MKVGCSLCGSPTRRSSHSEGDNEATTLEASKESNFMAAALAFERLCLILFCGATAALSIAFFIYVHMLQEAVPGRIRKKMKGNNVKICVAIS